ncbi:MAG: divergent polysaccharide deacetylase family protein [Candidatus Omnitrophota bacterium]|nr:divergent polysaccharide deacetylase family protein [Candidatus Omnitrophota bacterium]
MKNKVIFLFCLIIITQFLIILSFIKKERAHAPLPKPKIKTTEKTKVPVRLARIAIVLDDWGYNLNNLSILKEISYPLTVAVLPNLTYSNEVSVEAHRLNKEIILHLPMEPQASEKVRLEQDTVMSGMSKDKIIAILNKGLINLSYASGVSNHMGSKLTQDEAAIRIIFEEIKKKKLFFLDSMTSKSVCKTIAKTIGVNFAWRSVFIDNILDEAYIEQQIRLLVRKAKLSGSAIGIGHDRRPTLAALKRLMPEIEKAEGVKFVFVSELAD